MNEFQLRDEFLRFLRDRKEAGKVDWQQALDEFCSKTGLSRLVISPDWMRVMQLREPPQAFQPKISDAASVEQVAYARICKNTGRRCDDM